MLGPSVLGRRRRRRRRGAEADAAVDSSAEPGPVRSRVQSTTEHRVSGMPSRNCRARIYVRVRRSDNNDGIIVQSCDLDSISLLVLLFLFFFADVSRIRCEPCSFVVRDAVLTRNA